MYLAETNTKVSMQIQKRKKEEFEEDELTVDKLSYTEKKKSDLKANIEVIILSYINSRNNIEQKFKKNR